jgi:excisionase family DNA binding protein
MDELLDVNAAAEFLRLKTGTVYKAVCSRRIPFIKLHGKLLFSRDRLERWVQEHAVEPLDSKNQRKESSHIFKSDNQIDNFKEASK